MINSYNSQVGILFNRDVDLKLTNERQVEGQHKVFGTNEFQFAVQRREDKNKKNNSDECSLQRISVTSDFLGLYQIYNEQLCMKLLTMCTF